MRQAFSGMLWSKQFYHYDVPRWLDGDPTQPVPPASRLTGRNSLQVDGRTVDIQAYTRFLRQLEASPWIIDVLPVSAQTIVEKERPVTAFTIRGTYRQADSAYIRTVPLSQSVR